LKAIMLKGGRVIDPASALDGEYDVLVRDGEISAVERVGARLNVADANIIDVTGCWVVPGLIDPHVHLRDPGFPEKETILTECGRREYNRRHWMLGRARADRSSRTSPRSGVS